MAASPSLVRQVAPEFAGLLDPALQAAIDRAAKRVSASYFGELYDEAVALLAAHLLKVTPTSAGSSTAAGPVTGRSAGGLSESYAALPWSASWYNLSTYGQQFRELVRNRYLGPLVS